MQSGKIQKSTWPKAEYLQMKHFEQSLDMKKDSGEEDLKKLDTLDDLRSMHESVSGHSVANTKGLYPSLHALQAIQINHLLGACAGQDSATNSASAKQRLIPAKSTKQDSLPAAKRQKTEVLDSSVTPNPGGAQESADIARTPVASSNGHSTWTTPVNMQEKSASLSLHTTSTKQAPLQSSSLSHLKTEPGGSARAASLTSTPARSAAHPRPQVKHVISDLPQSMPSSGLQTKPMILSNGNSHMAISAYSSSRASTLSRDPSKTSEPDKASPAEFKCPLVDQTTACKNTMLDMSLQPKLELKQLEPVSSKTMQLPPRASTSLPQKTTPAVPKLKPASFGLKPGTTMQITLNTKSGSSEQKQKPVVPGLITKPTTSAQKPIALVPKAVANVQVPIWSVQSAPPNQPQQQTPQQPTKIDESAVCAFAASIVAPTQFNQASGSSQQQQSAAMAPIALPAQKQQLKTTQTEASGTIQHANESIESLAGLLQIMNMMVKGGMKLPSDLCKTLDLTLDLSMAQAKQLSGQLPPKSSGS